MKNNLPRACSGVCFIMTLVSAVTHGLVYLITRSKVETEMTGVMPMLVSLLALTSHSRRNQQLIQAGGSI